MSDQPSMSVWKGRLKLNSSHLDASQDTELILDSNWHPTSSQVSCNWHFQKNVIKCKDGGEGLAVRLAQNTHHLSWHCRS